MTFTLCWQQPLHNIVLNPLQRRGRSTFFEGKNADFFLGRQGSMKPPKTPSLVQAQEETGSFLKYLKQSSSLKQLIGLTLSLRRQDVPQAMSWYYTGM